MAEDFGEYRRLIEDFMGETRHSLAEMKTEMQAVREQLIQLRTQLTVARWLITPLVAALSGGAVAALFKRFGG